MAYGFSHRQPALGLHVQQAVQGLHMAYEAILPHFNRYLGAQAVGSAADWYVCRPTARTWRSLERAGHEAAHIYTHGARSVEAAGGELHDEVARRVLEIADAGETVLVGAGWPDAGTGALGRVGLARLLSDGLPAAHARRERLTVVVNLSDDPGGRLLRALLAANAARVVALVPNRHPDLADQASQAALQELVAAKYRLRFRRSTPDSRHAVVEASAVDPGSLDDVERVRNRMLHRAHGKVGNVWRDALVRGSQGHPGRPVPTKNEAREIVRRSASRPDTLSAGLVEFGRHDVAAVLTDVAGSVAVPADGTAARA
ncbi:hypothetical protein [Marinactinospora rubrisoli]|uniref:Uncharacterized protein n=1 Tax=Marinactinospora rubrisoli TaxID=2715399 RepID=A0ABW2KKS8_9ACTN